MTAVQLSFTEDTAKRYEAYGWQVLRGSMYDFEEIARLTKEAKAETTKPSIIILQSIIGKGSPHKQNTADIHGAPLGAEEVAATRAELGIHGDFYVAPEAVEYFTAKQEEWKKTRETWLAEFEQWSKENPAKRAEWDFFYGRKFAPATLPSFTVGDKSATRSAVNKALGAIAAANANLGVPRTSEALTQWGSALRFTMPPSAAVVICTLASANSVWPPFQTAYSYTAGFAPSAQPSWFFPTTCVRRSGSPP